MISVSDYTFSEKLNPGDKPIVIKAMSNTTGRFVAIKYFPPEVLKLIEQGTIFRMINIFSIMRHKNIASIHEVVYNKDGAFIVLDWCEGNSLFNTIQRFGCLQEKLVARYTVEMIRGLQYLHMQGRPHTNLKASNLLLSNGTLKISDFGLSAELRNRNILASPYWHPPEVLESKSFSVSSDIWSMGCTIVELLTGKPPFGDLSPEEAKNKILSESPPLPPKASAHLQDFLCGCFARNPEDRTTLEGCFNFFFVKNAIQDEPQSTIGKAPSGISIQNQTSPRPFPAVFDSTDTSDNETKLNIVLPTNQARPAPLFELDSLSDEPIIEIKKDPIKDVSEQKPIAQIEKPVIPEPPLKIEIPTPVKTPKKPKVVANTLPGSILSTFIDDDKSDINIDNGNEPLVLVRTTKKIHSPVNFDLIDETEDAEEAQLFAKRIAIEEFKQKMISMLLSLSPNSNDSIIIDTFRQILDILTKEPTVRSCVVSQQGIMPIIEIIEYSKLTTESATLVLSVVFTMCNSYPPIKENFCLLGGIPPILKFLNQDLWTFEVRKLSLSICKELLLDSSDNTQMFIACNGIGSFVECLHYHIETDSSLVFLAIQGLIDIYSTRCGIQVADFCRLFMNAGLIPPLSEILLTLVDNPGLSDTKTLNNICELLSTLSQADTKVKIALSDVSVIENLVSAMFNPETQEVRRVLSTNNIHLLCKTIKDVSTCTEARDNLAHAGVMEVTCSMLKVEFDKMNTIQIHSSLIMLLAEMCKLSKERLAIVAKSRIITSLRPYLETNTELKSLTMFVLFDFPKVAFENKSVMIQLIDDKLLEIYISALTLTYWGARAMSAISMLSPEPSFGIIKILNKEEHLEKIRDGIEKVTLDNAPTMIQRLTEICKLSKELTNNLINEKFGNIVKQKIKMSLSLPSDSQIPVSLLDMILVFFQSEMPNTKYLSNNEVLSCINSFAISGNVRQKALAKRIIEISSQ